MRANRKIESRSFNSENDSTQDKKTIGVFATASFLNDMGSDMIYPIWPLFVTIVLGANMSMLGLLDGLGEALVSISQAASGYTSDRIKRRKVFIWTGYSFGGLSRIGYAFSTIWQHLIPFKILDRAGKIRGAPRDAIIADLSTHKTRGRNFGILRTLDNLGAVVGITITVFFFNILGYRTLFLFAAIPSLIGAGLIFLFIRERKMVGVKLFKGLQLRDLNRDFKLFLSLSAIFALGSFSYSFLLIYASYFGFPVTTIPILYLLFTVLATLSSYPFGWLADKIGRKPVLAIAYLLWMSVSMIFLLSQNVIAILGTFVLYGMFRGGFDTVQKTFASELAPKKFRASGLGAYQMIVGLCALPASVIAGLLWDTISVFTPLYLSFGLTFIALILLMFVKE
ncbi:MAG: MFS transporter [Candidatus Ranarchaeia archaeon]